jgi:hypothetical protein
MARARQAHAPQCRAPAAGGCAPQASGLRRHPAAKQCESDACASSCGRAPPRGRRLGCQKRRPWGKCGQSPSTCRWTACGSRQTCHGGSWSRRCSGRGPGGRRGGGCEGWVGGLGGGEAGAAQGGRAGGQAEGLAAGGGHLSLSPSLPPFNPAAVPAGRPPGAASQGAMGPVTGGAARARVRRPGGSRGASSASAGSGWARALASTPLLTQTPREISQPASASALAMAQPKPCAGQGRQCGSAGGCAGRASWAAGRGEIPQHAARGGGKDTETVSPPGRRPRRR